jgi:hypothetical protein
MESPAWRLLSHSAKRILECFEIEYMRKGGSNNGRLICTYADFEKAGVRRMSIAPAIRHACKLGFLQITQRGRFSFGGKSAAQYRLTYLPTASADPSDEWREINPKLRYRKRYLVSSENATGLSSENATPRGQKAKERKRYSSIDIYPSSTDSEGTNGPVQDEPWPTPDDWDCR